LFPSYNSARRFLGASIIFTFAALHTLSSPAAPPLLKSIPTEAIGDSRALDDSARPAVGTPIHLSLALTNFDEHGLSAYANGVTDPKSPFYQKWLKPEEVGEKFGAPISDIKAVVDDLNSLGFTKIKVWPNRMFISGQAPRGVVEKSFGIEIHGYDRDPKYVARGYSEKFYAPNRLPAVDAVLAGRLRGIFGLSTKVQFIPALSKKQLRPELAADGSLQPSDLATIYDTAPLHTSGFEGAGETIAIFSPTTYATSDVQAFEAANNITGTSINVVNVNGGAIDNLDQDEACLDIETVVGQAPASTVNVYEGPNDGSLDIFNQVEADDPDILSESYGNPEDNYQDGGAYASSEEIIREGMAAEGITMFASSGDDAAYDGAGTAAANVSVSIEAADPYVTGVGGTELTTPFGTGITWNGEVAWTFNDGSLGVDSGSGGGLSIFYPEPSWQTGTGVANSFSDGMRQVPDVAACASTPLYEIFTEGTFGQFGGTSASCPLWASSTALLQEESGRRFGCINPALYAVAASNPAVYHDIISGNNGPYTCTAGWDFVTGWGSADFSKLIVAFTVSDAYSFGGGLQMISLPYVYPTSDSVSQLFTGLVTSSGIASSQIATWEPQYENYVITPTPPAAVPIPGQGYWARFNSSSGGALTALGTQISLPYYGVTLEPGWNMVGDPYVSTVQIDNLQIDDAKGVQSFAEAASQGVVSPIFYGYNGSGYTSNTTGDSLESYAGYWIYSSQNVQLTFLNPNE
jgi:subtilase family serine protease